MTRGKWFPHPATSLALLIVWLILNSSLSFAHLLLGTVLGWGIPWATATIWERRIHFHRLPIAARLTTTVLYDIVVANLIVAKLILGPVKGLRPTFVRVPLDLQEPYAIWTLASIITLTPGTVSSVFSEDRRWLLVHVLDLEDENALIAQIKQRYEAPLKEIFE